MEWKQIESYILEKYPVSQTWEPESLMNWLRWAESEDYLFLIFGSAPGEPKKLAGLAIAKPVSDPRELDTGHPNDTHDPDGQTVFVDLAISESKKALQMICLTILSRFPDKPNVAFRRFGRHSGMKTYKFMHIRKTLLRKEK